MRNYINTKDLSAQIKAGLQICYKALRKDKHPERQYRLFTNLAESYLLKEKVRDYPKVAAMYQYVKKLVDKHLNGDKEKLAFIDQRIEAIESRFLKKLKVLKSDIKSREQEITGIGRYKEELVNFREGIKKELASIEDLGIEKDKEELNEEGLQKRAQEVERIYMNIRQFFIGRRNETDELTEQGLVNRLIEDCVKQLGGLRVGKDNRECTYAVFGMGSLALGTMTPWSDLEFGILIEEGLPPEEEDRVKEYFRNLTSLLHIKVVNFGETPLRMMGIKELNNFRLTDVTSEDSEHDWFYDELIKSGFSFDGPHWHACKTPLGRKWYQRLVIRAGIEGFESCDSYELIGTANKFMKFQENDRWHRKDKQLVQALGHVVLIYGDSRLIVEYQEQLKKYKELKESRALEILREDCAELNPRKQIIDVEKEGQILNVKKEVYRFADRVIVALGDCLGEEGASSWSLIRSTEKIQSKQKQDLQLALSIATEVRLRTYANNGGQIEDISILSRYESPIKGLTGDGLVKEVFYLKDIKTLYRYCNIVLELSLKVEGARDNKFLEEMHKIYISKEQYTLIKGYTYKRFLKYYDAIREFEALNNTVNNIGMSALAKLYLTVGWYEKALELYIKLKDSSINDGDLAKSFINIGITLENLSRFEDALKYQQRGLGIMRQIYKKDHVDIAVAVDNLGGLMQRLDRFESALMYHQESFEIRRRVYKGDHISIANTLNNMGALMRNLNRYEEALKYHQRSMNMRCKVYKGDHPDVAMSLSGIGCVMESLDKFEEALKYKHEALEMVRRVYKSDHVDTAMLLRSISETLHCLGRFEEALRYQHEALEMVRRVYKSDHVDIALSLGSIGTSLHSLGRFDEALKYHQEHLEMVRRVYAGNDHTYIAASLCNIGNTMESLGRFDEALKYHQEHLEMVRRIYGNDHTAIATSLNNIALTLRSIGRLEEALKYHQKSLNMRRRIYGSDHTEIAASLSNIGTTLESLGRYKEALKYHEEDLQIIYKIYKGDHADVAKSLCSVGNTLKRLGRSEEALKYQQKGLEMQRRIYKGDHVEIAVSLSNIGTSLESLGRFEEALKYQKKGLEMQRRIYKGDHIEVATSLNNLGITLEKLGRFEEALKVQQEGLDMMRRIFKDDHADIAISLGSIGITLYKLGRFEEALKVQQEGLDMMRRIFKDDHADIAISLGSIGITLYKLGRFEEALKVQQEGLDMMRRIFKDDHADIANSLNNIGNILQSLDRSEEALKYHQKSLEMKRRMYKDDHVGIAASLNSIGATLDSLGRFEEALRYYQISLEMRYKIYENGHADIAASLSNIGVTLESLGRFEEALKYQQKGLEMQRRIYKRDHVDIAASLDHIGTTLKSLGKFEEALKYIIQSINIFKKFLPLEHSDIQIARKNFFKCIVLLANKEILLENYDKAFIHYAEAFKIFKNDTSINSLHLKAIIPVMASVLWQRGELNVAMSCYEVLSEKITPRDRDIKQKLANAYHVKAIKENEQGRKEKSAEYLTAARVTFEKAISPALTLAIEISHIVEYAQFLLKYYDKGNKEERDKIIRLLEVAIRNNDDSRLDYYKLVKNAICLPLQELLTKQDKITVQPKILAYYLLTQIYILHDNKEKVAGTLEVFSKFVFTLNTPEDCFLGYYLLGTAHRAKVSQVVKQTVSAEPPGLPDAVCNLVASYEGSFVNSRLALSFNKRGKEYFVARSYKAAIKEFSKVMGINFPNCSFMDVYNLARAYHEDGKIDKAINDYQKTIIINSGHAKSYYQLGICYKQKGDLKQAKTWFSQAINKDSLQEITQKSLEELSKLEQTSGSWKSYVQIGKDISNDKSIQRS